MAVALAALVGVVACRPGPGASGPAGVVAALPGTALQLPSSIDVGADGTVAVAPDGTISTVLGTGVEAASADDPHGDPALSSALGVALDVAIDPQGRLLVADAGTGCGGHRRAGR